jgi:hypothetical protein
VCISTGDADIDDYFLQPLAMQFKECNPVEGEAGWSLLQCSDELWQSVEVLLRLLALAEKLIRMIRYSSIEASHCTCKESKLLCVFLTVTTKSFPPLCRWTLKQHCTHQHGRDAKAWFAPPPNRHEVALVQPSRNAWNCVRWSSRTKTNVDLQEQPHSTSRAQERPTAQPKLLCSANHQRRAVIASTTIARDISVQEAKLACVAHSLVVVGKQQEAELRDQKKCHRAVRASVCSH